MVAPLMKHSQVLLSAIVPAFNEAGVVVSVLERMNPARGPRSILWEVLDTTSQCGTGSGCTPATISPLMWAISATR